MSDKEDMWTGIGIMCVLIGIGGCCYLSDKGDAEKIKARHSTETITTNKVEKGQP